MSRPPDSRTVQILNDQFRQHGPGIGGGNWLSTSGVTALGPDLVLKAACTVRRFSEFTEGSDPWGEHDFGAFELAGERLFWKIDYYNLARTGASPDPADSTVTCRVLTIMLASEY